MALAAVGDRMAGAALLASVDARLLYRSRPARSPAMLGIVAGVLFAVALAQTMIPARRATRIDPMASAPSGVRGGD